MSCSKDSIRIEDYIASELWFTSLVVYESNPDNFASDISKTNVTNLSRYQALISNLIERASEKHDCWLIYILLRKLINNDICDIQRKVQNQCTVLQMLYALQMFKNIPLDMQQDLMSLCDFNSKPITSQTFRKILDEWTIFLKTNIYNKPSLSCWITNQLFYENSGFPEIAVSDKPDIYLSIIKQYLEHLSVSKSFDESSVTEKYFKSLLCILSRMPVLKEGHEKFFEWFYPALLKIQNLKDIELSMYSNANEELFRDWNRFLDEANAHFKAPSNLETAEAIYRTIFRIKDNGTVTLNTNELIQRLVKAKSHWLSDILDICYIFTTHGKYDNVVSILSCDCLKNLWPVVLFQFLNKPLWKDANVMESTENLTSAYESVKFLLDRCNFDSSYDPALQRLDARLKNHIKIASYIQSQNILKLSQKNSSHDQSLSTEICNSSSRKELLYSTKDIISLLYHSTVLSVLRTVIDIHEQDCDTIQNLLLELGEPVHTFQAYYTILSALKAILMCEKYDTKCKEIASQFCDLKKRVMNLYPLDVRIRTLQDIFSLFFLQYEDFDVHQSTVNDENSHISYEESTNSEQNGSGFICNKYAIRDVLFYLQDMLSATEAELEKLQTDDEVEPKNTDISVAKEDLLKLRSAVTDAKWRLELHTNSDFISGINNNSDIETSLFVGTKLMVTSNNKMSNGNWKKKGVFFYEEESTSEGTKVKTDSSSESSSMQHSGKCKKRSRNSPKVIDTSIAQHINQKPILINFMFASTESLLIQCLWKNDYKKGEQIIQMAEKKNLQLMAELRFSKAVRSFKENLYKATLTSAESSGSQDTQSTIFNNIRLAAREGVQASRYTNQVETFLASQETHLQMLTNENANNNEAFTLCMLDLALTSTHHSTLSNNLCDVAMKYLKLCKTLDNTEHAHFFSKIYQLLQEDKNEKCVADFLCDAKIPLSAKEHKERRNFWQDITNKHSELKESQANKDAINEILKDDRYLPGLRILEKTAAICKATGSLSFMQSLTSYLEKLHSIIPTENTVHTVSDMLTVPLYYYFGHQIFHLGIEPNQLEQISHDLQVNLPYSILINVCPKMNCTTAWRYNACKPNSGCIVLNEQSREMDTRYIGENLNQCVADILRDLLEVLQNIHPNQSSYENWKSSIDHSDVQCILEKTSHLADLDLSELSVGNETLAFFINLWNLMFLHANLLLWKENRVDNDLWHTIALTSVGYIIGDLGLVTLSALRSKLLNNVLSDNTIFLQIEELNEPAWQDLDITCDPRAIFVMANEYDVTPRIQVCNAGSLEDDLNNAFKEYLNHYSSQFNRSAYGTNERRRMILPDLIRRYENFIENIDLSGNTQRDKKPLTALDYLNSSEENVEIDYQPISYAYHIPLKYPEYLHNDRKKSTEKRGIDWQQHSLRTSLLQYLDGHCWLLSYILQKIHHENPAVLEYSNNNSKRTACLDQILSSPWIAKIKRLFNDNETLATISDSIPLNQFWEYLQNTLKAKKWHDALDLINSLPDITLAGVEVQCVKNKILSPIVSSPEIVSTSAVLEYLYQMKDVHILVQTIQQNMSKFQVRVCEYALLYALQHVNSNALPTHCKLHMKRTLRRIAVFHKMLPFCESEDNYTWYDIAYSTEKIDPFRIISSLINAEQFELCLEWLECQAFSLEIHPSLTQDFLIGLLKYQPQNSKQALKLLRALPLGQAVKLCKAVLNRLESVDSLQFVANYLLEHCKATETIKYRRTLVGIDMLRMLDTKEKSLYIHLIKYPLLLLEQLLMNCKFESVQKILSEMREKAQYTGISISNFDQTILFYAQKSLDFRVSLHCDGIDNNKSKNVVQTPSDSVEDAEFIMPVNVPTKQEWMPDEKARKCCCCKSVIFSMFNKRHHCRRCGRVICGVCSQHRVHVPGYPPSVPVRVCVDCKRQMEQQMLAVQGTPSTPSSEVFDYWKLTRDQAHNQTIREEFSFEYAPNISLCLAILNLHSDHQAYTSFLLDRCDEMKRLLVPVSGGKINREIDHTVIIKMIRSLLIAAKVKSAKLGLNTDLAHCDRFLSQVDLITIMVESDCLDLIPTHNLDDRILGKLRGLLIEREQWKLALDMSTKAGWDTQGVWASWGKACLKMGYFDQAREKFFHCLDKIIHEDFDDWVVFSYPKESLSGSKSDVTENEAKIDTVSLKRSDTCKIRPIKDPPLLTEILQILDILSVQNFYLQNSAHIRLTATQEILNTFGNLKISGQASSSSRRNSENSQNVYYQESLYYLLTYGSFNSTLEFFLKHEEFDKCLTFVLENDLDADLFFNSIYLHCLKNGWIDRLHDTMKNKDPSLLAWKKYLINVCYNLERRDYLHVLYQLQLFMKDSVRASMTCIRFYVRNATDYTDLCSRAHFLIDAQKHLESELESEMLNRRRKKSTNSVHSNQGILTMELEPLEIDKHINTISRQMEIAKFLCNCEKEGRAPVQFLNEFHDVDYDGSGVFELPTLFGNQQQKVHLAVLAILSGRDIGEGFGIAFRITQDYNLPQQKVYSLAGHVLAQKNNVTAIEQLIRSCHTSGTRNSHAISDHVLIHCIKLLLNRSHSETGPPVQNQVDSLTRLVTDTDLKINAYIESKQLKAAYLLSVKRSRAQDIRRILKEADRLGQTTVKTICEKWLQQQAKQSTPRRVMQGNM